MKDFILPLLIDPVSKSKLVFDESENKLVALNGGVIENEYEVRNNVPLILPKVNGAAHGSLLGNAFDYVAHYEEDANAFNYFVDPDDPATRHENRRLHEAILSAFRIDSETVLDVGCGGGWIASALLPLGKRVISFDVAFGNVEKVSQKHKAENHFGVVGDVLNLPFADGSLDAVVSAEVIEHVLDTKAFVENLVRVLKPGGRAIISTPYKEKIQSSLCIHCNNLTPHNAHLRSFDEHSLSGYLEPMAGIASSHVILSNKALLYLQTHRLLGWLPYRAWRWVDKMADAVVNKPSRIIYIIDKAHTSQR